MDRVSELAVNAIRTLTVDAVEKARSGHPGLPMGCADFAFVLWTKFLKINPADPRWPDRDRFVLSAGHGSMLLYSLFHLAGFEQMTMDQVRAFRQWGSATPGHPEFGMTDGVECTTGPLGQGTGNSVGMAIAQKFKAARFNEEGFPVCDHRVYAIVSDGDLEEGVSHEVAALAGHLGLDNLTWFFDDNRVSIEGMIDLACSDDVGGRFAAYGWHVIRIDGHDHGQIEAALREAIAHKGAPTIIIGKTIIGKGSPARQGQPKAHSDPFGPEEVAATKRNLGCPEDRQFDVPAEVRELFAGLRTQWAARGAAWQKMFGAYGAKYPEKAAVWRDALEKRLPAGLEGRLPSFAPGKAVATRSAGGEVLKVLMSEIPWLVGGSADLAPSTKTYVKACGSFQKGSPGGQNLHFGIREHGMGAIIAGLAYHGGLIPFGSTFFVFTDYMRPPIRLAALSHIQAIFVMTHDSIFVGEDGPTHQPVETLATVRAIPNASMIRPADANEAAQAWLAALDNRTRPTVLVLSRQDLPVIDRSECAPASGVRRGAYVLWESAAGSVPEIILIGTGSEVHLCLEAGRQLGARGRKVRVVSMPSWDLFEAQPQAYRDGVLPPAVHRRVVVEAGVRMGWERYIGDGGRAITVDRFGASAPYQVLAKEYGLTVESVMDVAGSL
ncbi:MAG TPA: transketolase [Verrucomicrobiae bacterium]|nr:transketolase [Verrucomicrobiae bacterium]